MDLWMQCLAESEARIVLLSDWPTDPVEAIFFYARSHDDDDENIFRTASELASRFGGCVVINGSDGELADGTGPGVAWAGKGIWIDRLKDFGITPLLTRPALDNKDENEAFLSCAIAQGWKSAAILTQPHQIVRTFLGAVKSMADRDYWMRLHAVAPKSVDWWKVVRGSQGAEALPRGMHIGKEDSRIPLYQLKGKYGKGGRDLATYEELFAYLQRRNAIA